jgi:hypothetical protein
MTWNGAFYLDTLSCVCRSGEQHRFEVRVEGANQGDVWFYLAKPLPCESQGDEEYFASVKRVGQDLWQTEGLKNDLPKRYHGCGITRALIPLIATHRSARIRSSRNTEGETFTDAARRVWQRMVNENIARYDSTEDRFYYPAAQAV